MVVPDWPSNTWIYDSSGLLLYLSIYLSIVIQVSPVPQLHDPANYPDNPDRDKKCNDIKLNWTFFKYAVADLVRAPLSLPILNVDMTLRYYICIHAYVHLCYDKFEQLVQPFPGLYDATFDYVYSRTRGQMHTILCRHTQTEICRHILFSSDLPSCVFDCSVI